MDILISNINKLMPLKSLKYIKQLLIDNNITNWDKYKKQTNYYYKNIVYKDKYYEIVLISWKKDVITPIHDHPKNGCILKVLEGQLSEDYYDNGKIINKLLNKNDIAYRDGGEKHTIKALENSYSLHIYSPPNFYN
jgi:cysteine dioxygenase